MSSSTGSVSSGNGGICRRHCQSRSSIIHIRNTGNIPRPLVKYKTSLRSICYNIYHRPCFITSIPSSLVYIERISGCWGRIEPNSTGTIRVVKCRQLIPNIIYNLRIIISYYLWNRCRCLIVGRRSFLKHSHMMYQSRKIIHDSLPMRSVIGI